MSQCSDCGNLCESFPITDLSSLELYSSRGCTLISGDLHIANLPSVVHEDLLFDHMGQVRFLRGSLIVLNNQFLSSLAFLRNVQSVVNVVLFNNPTLVDARLPSLQTFLGTFQPEGCDRLCPARYTALGPSSSDEDCPNLSRLSFISVGGPVDLSINHTTSVLRSALNDFSNGTVCAWPFLVL